MKKVLYINLDFQNYKNKTLAQLRAFNKKNIATFLIALEQKSNDLYEIVLYKYENNNLDIIKKREIYGKKNRKNAMNQIQNYIISVNNELRFDIVYIRRVEISIIFLKRLFKELNKTSKIVYEFPTFPFDTVSSKKTRIYQRIELIYFKLFIQKYIKCISIYKQNKIKKNKKMVEIYNGIEIEKYDISNRKINTNIDYINFVGIAHVNRWHGYGKFIEAIENYNGNRNITFTIISNKTEELERLKKIVTERGLQSRIHFKDYDKINNIMEECNLYDIAIGGISYYERGAIYDTSIKNKEYCAMGIPFVNCCKDLSFPSDFKYMYTLKDKKIDMHQILNWYDKLEKKQILEDMHAYAKENLTFDKSIQKIIDFIGE